MGALTILDDICIATPCRANWDDMTGDDRVRECALCARSVYNIAAMTSEEATALIAGREGRLCARLFRRADGTIVTADCPTIEDGPTLRQSPRLGRVRALAIVLAALLLLWMGTNAGRRHPSGPGVTWDDWVHWAAVSLGLRPAPVSAPVYVPTISMGSVAY
jgi:hypothetical protein